MKNLFFVLAATASFALFSQPKIITTIAGIPGLAGYSGDGGSATAATLNFPVKAACDAAGNIYFADNGNNVIRKRDVNGNISTFAGNGIAGNNGDGGPATSASISNPWGIAIDPTGNIYFPSNGNVIRKVDINTGIISTVVGTGATGYSGDGGPATAATMNSPTGLAIDGMGNMYITDDYNNVVRRVDGGTGIITTYAGTGASGFSGDGGPATSAKLAFPVGISVGPDGTIYLSDNVNNRIRKIDNVGIINTIAGNGFAGYGGDGGPATSATLNKPWDAIADQNGNVYIADFFNCRVRKIDGSTGIISTYAGSSCGYGGDGGPATSAKMNAPTGLCFDGAGNLVVVDAYNNILRRVGAASTNISCSSASPINNNLNNGLRNYSGTTTSNNIWFSFVAESTDEQIIIINNNVNSSSNFSIVETFEGTCGNLMQLTNYDVHSDTLFGGKDSLFGFVQKNLTIGNTYYVKLSKTSLDLSTFKIYVAPNVVESESCTYNLTDFCLAPTVNRTPVFNGSTKWTGCAPGIYFVHLKVVGGNINNFSTLAMSIEETSGVFSGLGCFVGCNMPQQTDVTTTYFYIPPTSTSPAIYDYLDWSVLANGPVGASVQVQVEILTLGGSNINGTSTVNFKIVNPISAPASLTYCKTSLLTLSVNNDPNYNYQWYNSTINGGQGAIIGSGPSITLYPPINLSYPLIWVGNGPGSPCLSTLSTINLTALDPSGNITATASSANVCSGQAVTFNVSGVGSYSITNNHDNTVVIGTGAWTGSSTTFNVPLVTSPTSVLYTVYSTVPWCANAAQVLITVKPHTDFIVNSSPSPTCPNSPITLSAQALGGSLNFNWSGPNLNSSCTNVTTCNAIVSPASTTVYNVTGTSSNGCPFTKSVIANVLPIAQIGLGTAPNAVTIPYFYLCQLGLSTQSFSAINASSSYQWSISPNDGNITFQGFNGNNSQTVDLLASNPNSSTNYILTLTVTNYLPGGQPCVSTTNIPINSCCTSSSTGYALLSNTSLSGNITGNFVVTGLLYIPSACTLSNSNLIMNPGSRIVLGANLTINNSHLYSCSDMWNGIGFDGISNSPTLNISNTLIEDAEYAIDVAGPALSQYQSFFPNISLNNTWFNRCAVGIANDFDPLNQQIQPINSGNLSVNNCVFTCRSGISMAAVSSQNTGALSGLPSANLRNFKYDPNYYTFTGIGVGGVDVNMVVRNNLIKNCFFDNIMDGILGFGNVTVTKSTFQNMRLRASSSNVGLIQTGNYGINNILGGTAVSRTGSGVNFYGSQLTVGGTVINGCTFNNSDYGVVAEPDGQLPVYVTQNKFNSTLKGGIYYTCVSATAQQSISFNKFNNHLSQAINAFFVPATLNTGQQLIITANTFSISPSFYSGIFLPGTLPEAISVNGFLNSNFSTNSRISITGNKLKNYLLGITALAAPLMTIADNTIDVFEDPSISIFGFTHGIAVRNCDNAFISKNKVSTLNNIGTFKYGQFGIFMENSVNATISCNDINGADVALKCQGSNSGCSILSNDLKDAAIFKFWLDNNGLVGPQGQAVSGTYPSGFMNANEWKNSSVNDLFTGNGTNGVNSPFYFANAGNYVISSSSNDASANVTSIPFISLPQAADRPSPCGTIHFTSNKPPIMQNGIAQKIANNTLQFQQYNSTAEYGNKLDLYRTLLGADNTSYNDDATLVSFLGNLSGTSQAELIATDTIIGNSGNDTMQINLALSHNTSFLATDNFDASMQQINNLYGEFLKRKRKLSPTQVQQIKNIAQLCPFEHGEGVYRARALLSRFDELKYTNICEESSYLSSPGVRIATAESESRVKSDALIVYPNPASSTLFVEGLHSNEGDHVEMIIFNNMGELILKTTLTSNQSAAQKVNIDNLNSGSYTYKILINEKSAFVNKLIILK